jgi:hypothetical protein
MSRTPTRPTHTIKVMDRATKQKGGRVGAAWLNKDGSISIQLDVGISLSWNDGLMITAFENNKDGEE